MMALHKQRAQAATEYLMIAGFLVIVIGIAYLYSSTILSNSIDDSKARTATNSIAKAIDQVYALGPGSKISVTVDLPSGIQSQIVENQLVGYILTVNGQPSYYYADTKANLKGELPLTQGVHEITLTVNNSGEVVVGETGYGLFLTPKTILVSLDQNVAYNQTHTFNLSNTNPSIVGNISITKSGTASGLITIGSYSTTLNPNTDQNFDVTITVPDNQPIGTYNVYLQVDSNNGSDRSLIQIIVYAQGTVPGGECTTTSNDTNWQTSWTIFDANMKTQYQLINENTLHWHDTKYYTQAQSDENWNKYTLINADINFRQLQNYPPGCPNGYAIHDMNDTNFTCIAVGGSGNDTNWQTSWTLLDANLRATYSTINQTAAASFFDDFDGTTVGQGWTAVNSGTSAAESLIDVVAGENTMGVLQWSTGTTATGRAALIRNTGSTSLGQGKFDITVRAKVPTLSVVAQEFSAQLGLHDATTKNAVDGVYFHYNRLGYGSDVIRCVTSSNSARTTNSSGVTMNTNWNKYKIIINPSGTQALFYINEVLVCTHTTNIPTGASRVTGPSIQIIKSAGTTARTLLVDYWQQDLNFTTTR
jgi:uncharacterized protein (UPF0333 family)